MTRLYQFVRNMHRLMVLVTFVMTVGMVLTGSALKYKTTSLTLFPKLDLVRLRYVHNQLSPYFTGVLGVMALTGLGMYLLPPLMRRRAAKRQQPPL